MHIYTEGIYRHGHGLPMWNPRPFKKVVDVGDLGYIDDSGSFITLFNITVPPRGQQEFQTPTGFQHFSPTPPLNILVREASITRRYLKSGIDVDVPQSSTCTMRWNIQRGAIVILNEKPKKLYITQSQPLLNYIAKHQEQWYQFLQGHSGCPAEVINSSRLLLVTGVHRTFSWSLGAWSRSLPSHSLSCTLPTSDGMAIDWHPDPAPGIRIGPLSPNRVQNIGDESLFVEGYRISRRNRRHQDLRTGVPVDAGDKTLSKLRGLMKDFTCFGSSSSEEHGPAPPSTSLPSSPTSHSADIQADSLQFIGNTELPRHPLDGLIDRVFSALPDIQTAIIHDHDWLRLAKWNEPRYEPSHSLIKQNIITDGTCAYFGFSSLEFPFLDLGPVIAKHAIRLSPDTVRRLCLASKQLHSLCTPILYYRIQFSQTEKLHNFFDAISSNPNLGQHVRHFYAEEVTIPSSAEFKYCSSLYTLALFSFCQDMQGAKHLLPPSVRHLACDPGYFTALTSPFISSKNTFQSITHLHLLTKLPAIQMWSWLGQNNMPVLTHLAVEHHFDSSLQDASQELIPLVTEHLSAHIKVCMLLLVNSNRTLRNSVQNTPIDRTHGLRKILDRASISLSDGTVDERVVLAATSVEPLWSLGYLLTVHLNEIRQPWATSSPSLWVRAEKVLHDRKVGGILPAEYYDGGETKRALDTIRGLFDFQPLQEYSCLEETHEKVLKPIENWVDNVNVPNIFWLEGYPGAEKTAISICLEQYLAKTGRLGASCFFRHEDASHHRLDSLIRSIAFQLANNHDSIKDTLVQAVNSGAIHFDSGPSNLFEKLICDSLAPCSNFSDSIVFVIDAMDEFGLTEKVRLRLKNILFPRWIQLPRQCKLFITSRFQSEPAPFKVDVNKFGVRSGSGFGFYYNIL
ncbi:hypothetical protein DL96DRAFT_1269645 [Flagelloscypha sp. PMI_526]|nr:hypothetical protein DL96DRAFT_1269645 [Flagelloscypha sp. PMI_526]